MVVMGAALTAALEMNAECCKYGLLTWKFSTHYEYSSYLLAEVGLTFYPNPLTSYYVAIMGYFCQPSTFPKRLS